MATQFPFSAIVGAPQMELALILTTVSPEVGGVLVRGEKGTAKSTMVRALAEVLPQQAVVVGCRFGCDPADPDPTCPDGPHGADADARLVPARLVELPVGATEDRVTGSLDLGRALGGGEAAFEPGLLADANRGILYVDEVNLLHDHLVDLLLDAAAMGRNTVERDGVSVSHAARMVLVGTMNPEEGELRPQLLDRFGLTVEVAASREPAERVEVVRRRLAFDADPEGFAALWADQQRELGERIASARAGLAGVRLTDWALTKIATVCAAFDVDGMRADIVTARAARAHAAWQGRDTVTREDIRVAAVLALPHRRRRKPFDAPGLDEELLDRLLGDDDVPPDDPEPEPPTPPTDGDRTDPEPADADQHDADQEAGEAADQPPQGQPSASDGPTPPGDQAPVHDQADPAPQDIADQPPGDVDMPAPVGIADAEEPYRVRHLAVRGVGAGEAGRRSRAITSSGRTVGATRVPTNRIHLPATITAAALSNAALSNAALPDAARADARLRAPGSHPGRLRVRRDDLRHAVTQGRESNLVLLVVDSSGSMAARKRMSAVKTAVLSMLTDAYQRRDRVGVVTFRGSAAAVALPPTHSVEAAAVCLADLPHGGRTPLAEALETSAHLLRLERIRDPRRRPLLVLVTDGRATSGADALARAQRLADRWPDTGVDAVVVDCEGGRFRMGLARDLATRMGAQYLPLGEVSASGLVDAVRSALPSDERVRAADLPGRAA